MELLFICGLVFLLYVRTLDYNYVIDDNVKRQGYMYEVPLMAPAPSFFDTKPSRWYRLFMIGMHCANVSIIYLLWGWIPALLFAVHPLGVWGTAWVTGNYYATTAYFILVSYFIMHQFPNLWGALAAMPFYVAALNSTINGLTFPFLFLFGWLTGVTPWGLLMGIPLVQFLRGKRFTVGIAIREKFVTGKRVPRKKFAWNRIFVMTKVTAKYIYTSFFPDRLGFFGGYGHELHDNPEVYKKLHSADKEFWAALAVCVAVFAGGMLVSPFGTLWFFCFIGLHSQFNLMGQFYAERYLYLPLVGICIIVGTILVGHPILTAIVATILVVRTHFFIPAWRNMGCIWQNDIDAYPYFGEVYSNRAQYYLNRPPISAWRLNEIASDLFKALEMEPRSWKVLMNLACFFAVTQNWAMVLEFTNKAIAILEEIGGEVTPLKQMYKQREDVENLLKNGGAITSLPQQEEGVNHGTRTTKTGSEERILEPFRDSGSSRGTPGIASQLS